jgi:flagellar basal-body rod protein FlgF
MDRLLISAASGMKARMESLDMLANNLANTGTVGFKADREFYGLFEQSLPMVEKQWTDYSQGVLTPTENPLDLALAGQGFFVLNSPAGLVYTRGGEFQISKQNQLQTAEGFTLRNARDQGKPIKVDPQAAVDIGTDGVVRQGGQEIAQIEVAAIESATSLLRKMGTSYFAMMNPKPDASQPASQPTAKPTKAATLEVKQGMLEQSNVPVADMAVRLVNVMRQFEMLQRALTVGSEMNKHAMEEVARIT